MEVEIYLDVENEVKEEVEKMLSLASTIFPINNTIRKEVSGVSVERERGWGKRLKEKRIIGRKR